MAEDSLNTIAINELFIDRVENNSYSLYDLQGHALPLEPLRRE